MRPFRRFETLFNDRPAIRERIVNADPAGLLRTATERSLLRACGLDIHGTNKLAADCGGDAKLHALLAELRFAISFARLGAKVRLIPDQAFGPKYYAPDLDVEFKSGLRLLVDVVHGSHGAAPFSDNLHAAMSDAGLLVRVEHVVGAALSKPAIKGEARAYAALLSASAARAAANAIAAAMSDGMQTGIIRLFEDRGSISASTTQASTPDELYANASTAEADLAHVFFGPSPSGDCHVAGGITTAHFFDREGHEAKFLRDLEWKAQRREKLPPFERGTPFIVAYESDEFEMSPETTLGALTGTREHLCGPPDHRSAEISLRQSAYPADLQEASDRGWSKLLHEWDYGAGANVAMSDFGAFLPAQHGERWAAELSGVLVKHRVWAVMQWMPNPFAFRPICDPRLLEFGLPLTALGAPFKD